MLTLRTTKRFKRDLRKAVKRGRSRDKIGRVIRSLLDNRPLPSRYRDHKLSGNFPDCRECHIEPDWLLIYRKTDSQLVLIRTGTHSDLFNK